MQTRAMRPGAGGEEPVDLEDGEAHGVAQVRQPPRDVVGAGDGLEVADVEHADHLGDDAVELAQRHEAVAGGGLRGGGALRGDVAVDLLDGLVAAAEHGAALVDDELDEEPVGAGGDAGSGQVRGVRGVVEDARLGGRKGRRHCGR